MKQKTKNIVTALLLGVLCAVTLSAVITVPDWETARADLLIGMQYETTGLDLDAVKKAFAPYCTEVVEVTTAENFN